MKLPAAVLLSTIVAALLVCSAKAQSRSAATGRPDQSQPLRDVGSSVDREDSAARMFGALLNTKVSVEFSEAPAREAINAIRTQLGVPLIARYRDDPLGYGINPDSPITLQAVDKPALEVLEDVLVQCEEFGEECTWQIRKGFVEIGTKARLSVPAARETRTYHIADLIMHIPPNMVSGERKRREVMALGAIAQIVENIEPGAWDYGQIDYDAPVEPPAPGQAESEKRIGTGDEMPATGADVAGEDGKRAGRPSPPPRRYVSPRKIAIIRYWRDVLIVNAPDYIHRQVGGYPDPSPPAGADPDSQR